jgi:hypothetical protein
MERYQSIPFIKGAVIKLQFAKFKYHRLFLFNLCYWYFII